MPMGPPSLTNETCGTIMLGADLEARRLGFGAMRLAGPMASGPRRPPGGSSHSAPCSRIGRQLDRHNRCLWTLLQRRTHCRSSVSVPRRPGGRHQGWARTKLGEQNLRREYLRSKWPSGVPKGRVRGESGETQTGHHRPLSAPLARPNCSLLGVGRSADRASQRGQEPGRRPLERETRSTPRGTDRHSYRVGSE